MLMKTMRTVEKTTTLQIEKQHKPVINAVPAMNAKIECVNKAC